MSARIKQLDADGNVLQEEDSPELGYDHQEAPTGFVRRIAMVPNTGFV